MRAWLAGDLDGVDPRAEQHLLRDALARAVEDGIDPTPLVEALADLDAVACAELVAGPRAVPHRAVVEAALSAAPALESVLPAAGLHRRLGDLVPEARGAVLRAAVRRHGGAGWVWRLGRWEQPVARTVLDHLAGPRPAADPAPRPDEAWIRTQEACRAALAEGGVEGRVAVVDRAAAGDAAALRVLHDEAPDALVEAAARLLDDGGAVPVVAWVAAWHGPELSGWVDAIRRRLATEAGRAALDRALAPSTG